MGDSQELNVEDPSSVGHTSDDHWFEPLARHMGEAYLRYSFTKGTVQEVDALVELLGLEPGMSVLDVGCGPGRHALEFARRGYRVTGVDISSSFIDIAQRSAKTMGVDAEFVRHDARALPGTWAETFDVAICLCQGGFGLMVEEGDDELVFSGIVKSLLEGGRMALSAFNAYFAVKYFEGTNFDADRGLSVESTEVRDPVGTPLATSLVTGCYTPRELRMLARRHGLERVRVHGVEPGRYGAGRPSTELPEFLLLAERVGRPHW